MAEVWAGRTPRSTARSRCTRPAVAAERDSQRQHDDQTADAARLLGLKGFAPAGRPAWNLYYRFVARARGRGLALEAGHEALAVAAQLDPAGPVLARTRATNGPAQRLAPAPGLERRPELDADDGLVVYASFW